MKPILTIDRLISEAEIFCNFMSQENHAELFGVTDRKAIGTYVEHRFQQYLSEHYIVTIGNSAKGIEIDTENQLKLRKHFKEYMLTDFKLLPELSQESLMMCI